MKDLLEAKADPSIQDKANRTPAEYARQKGQSDWRLCVEALEQAVNSSEQQGAEIALAQESAFAPFLPQV